ncbi:MAG: hypothetical protein NVS1B11_31190 [Terriglobales bacterium]
MIYHGFFDLESRTLGGRGKELDHKFTEVKKIHEAKRAQIDMFEQAIPPEMKKLEFLKSRVQVSWLCKAPTCSGHRMQVLDWGLCELQRRESDERALARRRNCVGSGWVIVRGKKWYGYYRRTVLDPITNSPKTDVVPLVLGLKVRMTKSEAREELQKEIAKQTGQNGNGRVRNDGSVTFGWFVRNRYLPLREANWRPETAKVKKIQIRRDLIEKFESVPLNVIDGFMLQTHINHLATYLSEDRVQQARSYSKSIFIEAVDQDFLLKDPSRKVRTPLNLRGKDKTVLTWDQLRVVLANLSTKDRVLLTFEMTEALRPSELFALRWRSFDGSKLTITETVYKGQI